MRWQAQQDHLDGRLDDGSRVVFRHITPEDKGRLLEAFQRLSPESRYLRFFSPISTLTDEQLRYLTEVDFQDHFAWVAALPDEPGSPGVGVGRWVRSTKDPTVAEAAIAVTDDYHGRGIGKALLRLLVESAVQKGVREFSAAVLRSNQAMLRLLKELGATAVRGDHGVLELRVPLPQSLAELEGTPAPAVLRAAAAGHLEAHTASPVDRLRMVLKGA
jgi:RimJ/RimL family protein N-acetyltransferase